MSDILFFKDNDVIPFNAALITVDVDGSADRIVVMGRDDISIIAVVIKPASNTLKLVVPQIYATKNGLIVGIVDDNGVYDCKFSDGVKADSVDLNTVDMSQ